MDTDKSVSELWQQTYATLFATTNKLQMKGDGALEILTSRQLMLLIAISYLPTEDTTIINLSKMMGSSKQSTNQMVDILKKKGYLISAKSPKDGRAVNLSLTEEGERILQQDFDNGSQIFAQFFNGFTLEELAQLRGYLQRLYSYDGEEQQAVFERVAPAPTEAVIPDIEILESRSSELSDLSKEKIAKHARGKQNLVLTIGTIQEGEKQFRVYGENMDELLYEPEINIYEIGGITQTFTTTLLAKYCYEKRVSLEDTIDKYLPLPSGNYPTLLQLATHTAGYSSLLPLSFGNYAGRLLKYELFSNNPFTAFNSRQEMLALVGKNPIGSEAPYNYSNFGIGLLGMILGEISGRGWWDEMIGFVQNELNLTRTKPGVQRRLLPGYRGRKKRGNWEWAPNNYIAPAVSLTTTPEDLLEFGNLHMSGARPYLEITHQKHGNNKQESDIGLGWELSSDSDAIGQEGSTACFGAYVIFSKEKQAAVSIQSNYSFADIAGLGKQILEDI